MTQTVAQIAWGWGGNAGSTLCCCFTGVAANCASALAQMAAASCVQEEKEEKEIQEPSDAIAQGNNVIK